MTHSAEVLTGIRTALSADAQLISHGISDVYNYVPRASSMPYVSVRISDTLEYDTSETGSLAGYGYEHRVNVHMWSDKRGQFELLNVLDRIKTLLHNQPLTMAGDITHVSTLFLDRQVEQEGDGQVFHGVDQFRIITEEA